MKLRIVFGIAVIAAITACTAPTDTRKAPSPPDAREVTVATPDPAVTLAGTLLVPDDATTVVLLVTGTGNHVRDQVISGAPMFRTMAESIAGVGVASLRTDVRGAGGSTGPEATDSTTAERVVDMAAAVAWLRGEGFAEVGVIGHSAGAMIAAELAASDSPPDFVVLLGTPARKGIDVWVEQQSSWAADRPALYERVTAVLTRAAEKSIAGASAEDMRTDAIELFELAGLEDDPDHDAMVAGFTGRMSETAMRDFLASDPGALTRTRVPTLAVYGAADQLTSVAQNAPALVAALARAGNDDFQLIVIPEQDHFFLRAPGKPAGEHEFGKMELSRELLEVINDWLQAL